MFFRKRTLLISLSLFVFTHCKKENNANPCINIQQKEELLHSYEYLLQDTFPLTKAERQLMNEIRDIANDIDALYSGIADDLTIEEYYQQIKFRFLQHADLVQQKANLFYEGSEAGVILARNAFVLMSYDALQRKYPEFMWTQLGIFAANEVRSGLVMALYLRYTLRHNNIDLPMGNTGLSMQEGLLETSSILIQGQLNVLTDIGSLAILNKLKGAKAIKHETWLTAEAQRGFQLQEQAEAALNQGDCNSFMDLQTEAAIQFGAHEQIYILQPMWDQQLMKQFADIDRMIIQLTGHQLVVFGDIFIGTNKTAEAGKGYTIKLPQQVNDLSNAQQRVQVAMNGFNTLNQLRKDKSWSRWIDYSQIKIGYFHDVYLPGVKL